MDDYEQLMSLYNEFVGEDRYSHHDNDSFERVIASPNNYVFVAEDASKFIGFIAFSAREVVRYPRIIVEVDELYVCPSYRKQAVGRKLFEQMEHIAKDLHCYRIFIESHYDHKAAHSFYEAIGYTNYGYHFVKNL